MNMRETDTPRHILVTGRNLIVRKGYSNVGLNALLADAGVIKEIIL